VFKNPFDIMKQVEEFQKKFKENQEALIQVKITGESGAGVVKATVRGDFVPLKTELDLTTLGLDLPQEALRVLEELITSAYADAIQKAMGQNQGTFAQILGNMGLPANMPFPFGGGSQSS